MSYLFTSESVSEGHPDKVADQISDAILDEFLARDPQSHVAVETLCTTGQVVVAGEVSSNAYVDIPVVVRKVINNIGYSRGAYRFDGDSCGIFSAIHEQSGDIARGVNREEEHAQGAGDQGMMFGYATNETENYMPLTLDLSHRILLELAKIRREGDAMNYYRKGKLTTYLRPDAKSQVTVEYDDNGRPLRVHTIVVSTQHDEFVEPMDETPEALKSAENEMLAQIRKDVEEVLLPRVIASLPEETQKLFAEKPKLHVNPTGKFVLGGPHADTGLTGRKIIVDTYGGHGAHGGGAFSGKDPSKVDRSAAYACRHIAKNMVAAGVADQVLVQVAYAIGVAEPVSVMVNTYGTAKVPLTDAQIADVIRETVSLTPKAIEDRLQLRNPIYLETAAYGHMGRQPRRVTKTYTDKNLRDGEFKREVKLFTWEELDLVDTLKKAFKIH
ncbi:MAG: methionine adenosyltransferase [Bacteroides sp.]|nr:methionine adenosyltransferase [Bacteroides sp.]